MQLRLIAQTLLEYNLPYPVHAKLLAHDALGSKIVEELLCYGLKVNFLRCKSSIDQINWLSNNIRNRQR